MRYKKEIQYYAVTGVCIIFLKDRKVDLFLRQYIIANLICQIQVSITDSSSIISKICNKYNMRSYCVKQKKQTECVPNRERITTTSNGRQMIACTCAECGATKTQFMKSKQTGWRCY